MVSPTRQPVSYVNGISARNVSAVPLRFNCSPISDTTILSSMASASDHIDHVRTQLPYAMLVAIVGMIVGDIPTAYGLSPWISLLLGTAVLAAVLFFYAKPVGSISSSVE